MKTISIDHENNKLVLTKSGNIKIIIEGPDKNVYRVDFRELENLEGKPTMMPLFQTGALYAGWHCSETCNSDLYPNKILINIRGELGWFVDIVYDNIKDEFYRINTVRDTKILNKVRPPILIAGSVGGGTSYIAKILKYCGLYFGTDSGIVENRKHHESVTFSTMRDMLGFYKHTIIDWGQSQEGMKTIQKQLKDRFNFYHIQFKNQLEYKFSNFWGNAPTDCIWAFKNPSISLTLPLWKSIFPKSKLIIIKRNKEKISKNMFDVQGDWFRNEENENIINCYYNPDVSNFSKDDIFYCDFNKITTERKSMNELLQWIGLDFNLQTKKDFSNLLQLTGYEGRIE